MITQPEQQKGEWSTDLLLNRSLMADREVMAASAETFRCKGYVRLQGFLTDVGLSILRTDVAASLAHAKRRDFNMSSTEYTPRRMATASGFTLLRKSPWVGRLYGDPALVAVVGAIAGFDVFPVNDLTERCVLNVLAQEGDTHGGHTDDYPVALVTFLESPPSAAYGGCLVVAPEGVGPGAIDEARPLHHQPGDAYLLRADRFAHAVTPLRYPCVRSALNFAYSDGPWALPITSTAELLYG